MQTEILIVGAGPSGAAAGVQLGQLGIKNVLMVDRDRFPRNKTCGSGLSPTALHVAEALGIGPELRRRANPVVTVRFVTPAGEELRVPVNSAASAVRPWILKPPNIAIVCGVRPICDAVGMPASTRALRMCAWDFPPCGFTASQSDSCMKRVALTSARSTVL